MPQASPTNALFARAADKVMRTFAERTAGGELDGEAVVMRLADGQTIKGPAILGDEELQLVDDGGDIVKAYTRRCDLPLAYWNLDGIPVQATVDADGRRYAVADTGSKRTADWLTLQLQRNVTSEHAHLRR